MRDPAQGRGKILAKTGFMILIILSLEPGPTGKPAVNASDTITMMTLPFRCKNSNDSGLVAIQTSQPATVTTGRRFIDWMLVNHGNNSRPASSDHD